MELLRWKEPVAAHEAEAEVDSGCWLNLLLVIWTVWALWAIFTNRFSVVTFFCTIWSLYTFVLKPQAKKWMPYVVTEKGIFVPPFKRIAWAEIDLYWLDVNILCPSTRILSIVEKRTACKWYQPDLRLGRQWHRIFFDPREVDEAKLRAIFTEYVDEKREIVPPLS